MTKKEQHELKTTFNVTNTMGDVSIDSNHRLFKIKHASSKAKKKSGIMAKTGKATVAMMTAGASLAIEQAMKPNDKVFSFDDLRGFELLEDDAQIVGGGAGMALAGGALFVTKAYSSFALLSHLLCPCFELRFSIFYFFFFEVLEILRRFPFKS